MRKVRVIIAVKVEYEDEAEPLPILRSVDLKCDNIIHVTQVFTYEGLSALSETALDKIAALEALDMTRQALDKLNDTMVGAVMAIETAIKVPVPI